MHRHINLPQIHIYFLLLPDGCFVLRLAAKQLQIRKIDKRQNLNILNLGNALVHVFIQKDTQNRLRFGRILAEEVFFLNIASSLCGSATFCRMPHSR